MKTKVLIAVLFIILVAIVFYLSYPKYQIYQSVGGLYVYRFNKITGTIQIGEPKDGKWYSAIPTGSIQKP